MNLLEIIKQMRKDILEHKDDNEFLFSYLLDECAMKAIFTFIKDKQLDNRFKIKIGEHDIGTFELELYLDLTTIQYEYLLTYLYTLYIIASSIRN